MKILVTGDKGFIGQRLVKRLEKDNHTIVGIDTKANTNINRHLCSFLFDYSLSSFKQMQTQISRYFSFLLYPSLPVTNKYKQQVQ